MKKNHIVALDKFLSNYISKEWNLLLKGYATSHQFLKNERIFSEGDKVKGVYFINSGKIKIVSHFNKESERILRLSSGGDFLGHRAMTSTHYPISAIALTNAQVSLIPIDIFQKLIRTNPEFAIYIIDFLANDLKNTEDRMKSIIHNDVLVRIGIIIVMLIDAYGYDDVLPKKLNFTLPRSDMASFAGTTYESVIRNLAKLEEMKLIKLDNKSIHVLKEKELRKLITLST